MLPSLAARCGQHAPAASPSSGSVSRAHSSSTTSMRLLSSPYLCTVLAMLGTGRAQASEWCLCGGAADGGDRTAGHRWPSRPASTCCALPPSSELIRKRASGPVCFRYSSLLSSLFKLETVGEFQIHTQKAFRRIKAHERGDHSCGNHLPGRLSCRVRGTWHGIHHVSAHLCWKWCKLIEFEVACFIILHTSQCPWQSLLTSASF